MATKFRKTDKPNNLNWNERRKKKHCMRTANTNANNKTWTKCEKKPPEQYSCDIVKSKRQKIYLCMNMWFYRQEEKKSTKIQRNKRSKDQKQKRAQYQPTFDQFSSVPHWRPLLLCGQCVFRNFRLLIHNLFADIYLEARECSLLDLFAAFDFMPKPMHNFYFFLFDDFISFLSRFVERYINRIRVTVLLFWSRSFHSSVNGKTFKLICIWCLWPWSLLTAPLRTAQCTRYINFIPFHLEAICENVYRFLHHNTTTTALRSVCPKI